MTPTGSIKNFEKMDIPAASDKVVIAVNSENGNYIYTHDKLTGAIAEGMEYVGGKVHELSGPLTK